jgi:predicted metalloprotease with PDZ domain
VLLLTTGEQPCRLAKSRKARTGLIIGLQWSMVALDPDGTPTAEILTSAELRLPAAWQLATSLDVRGRQGNLVSFEPVSFDSL